MCSGLIHYVGRQCCFCNDLFHVSIFLLKIIHLRFKFAEFFQLNLNEGVSFAGNKLIVGLILFLEASVHTVYNNCVNAEKQRQVVRLGLRLQLDRHRRLRHRQQPS